MESGAKVTSKTLDSGETLLIDESGTTVILPSPKPGPHLTDLIDPRIDLTAPIYEQVRSMANEDQAPPTERQRESHAA